jgi:FtsZ-interacting cell division protein ZipA
MEENRTTLWRMLLGVLALALLVMGIWLLFFRDSGPKKQADKKPDTTLAASRATPAETSTNRQDTKSQTSPTQPAQSKSSTTASPQLANAGPTNTVSVFLIASIAGASLHYLYTKRHKAQYRS